MVVGVVAILSKNAPGVGKRFELSSHRVTASSLLSKRVTQRRFARTVNELRQQFGVAVDAETAVEIAHELMDGRTVQVEVVSDLSLAVARTRWSLSRR